MGIEPTLFAWEARVLPLNDTRVQLRSLSQKGRCCINQPQARFPQPQTWLRNSHRLRAAQFSKPIEDGGLNVQFVDLPLERA